MQAGTSQQQRQVRLEDIPGYNPELDGRPDWELVPFKWLLKRYYLVAAIIVTLLFIKEEAADGYSSLHAWIRAYLGVGSMHDYIATQQENFMDFDQDTLPHCDYRTMTPQEFYQQHVARYRPCLFDGYAREWEAFEKWQNVSYLRSKAGDEIIFTEKQRDHRFAYFTEGARRVYMSYSEFLDKFSSEDREWHYYFSFDSPPAALEEDMTEPAIAKDILEVQQISYWHGHGTATKPHTDAMENIICLFEGYKNFTVVSPFQRQFVYAGYNGIPDNYSPVNFTAPDLGQWPAFAEAEVVTFHVAKGDCLFMPAYWWHQVTSSQGVSLAVSTWYKTHSKFLDLAQVALQEGFA